jgi:adenosylcobinamide-GDP ribazoletransferase
MRGAEPARAALAATTFLTRVPIGGSVDLDARALVNGAVFFPTVGAAIGAAVGGTAFGLARVLPSLAAAGIALALGALLTGALHLDGLADTADGLGAPSREAALANMRDHATGVYGTTALVLDLVVKAAALAALAGHWTIVTFAIASGALGRAVPVALGAALPKARDDGGGAAFRVSPRRAGVAIVVAVAISFCTGVVHGFVLTAVAAGVATLLALCFRRSFGGVTGDTLGAAAELTETALLVTGAALI